MKLIITGSLGHIGKPLTEQLVQKGHDVTVVSSSPEKQKDIEALGATAAIGTIEDVAFLTATFAGGDAVYTMLPPPNFFNPSLDINALCSAQTSNYAQAIKQSGVKRVVHLSSIGAHMSEGSGLIMLHHNAENVFNSLQDVAITFMRPTAFYYNLLSFVPAIKNTGLIASNYGGDDVVSWVSPIDIATAIAEEIETPFIGKKVLYVASEELTCNEVAYILGEAISKPDLQWVTITNEQLQSGFDAFGMPKAISTGLVEMNAAMHTGKLFADYNLHKPTLGKTKLTEFAKQFAAAYNQGGVSH